MKNSLIIIPFNARLGDVCDYARQTVRIVSKHNQVVGIALNNQLSLWHDFPLVLKGKFLVRHWGVPVLLPVMIVPFQRFEIIRRLNIVLNIWLLNLWLLFGSSRNSDRTVLWFFEPRYLSHFLRFLRYDFSVYDCVDYFTGSEEWRAEQLWCLKRATVLTVNSQTLKERYQSIRPDLALVPLGFSHHDMTKHIGRSLRSTQSVRHPLTFGFVGAVGDRLDFTFLQRLITQRPQDTFVFIGPQTFTDTPTGRKKRQDFESLLHQQKLRWLPGRSRKRAWLEARHFDVGLIPYEAKSAFDRYSFPMKTIEYFYAGLPIVSSQIEELTRYPEHVFMPQRHKWRKLDSFLNNQSPLSRRARRRIALSHTWEKKLSAIFAHLENRIFRRNNQT